MTAKVTQIRYCPSYNAAIWEKKGLRERKNKKEEEEEINKDAEGKIGEVKKYLGIEEQKLIHEENVSCSTSVSACNSESLQEM